MAQSSGTIFIVYGTHITENLQHHKLTDVQRILEEKGFEKSAGDGAEYHFRNPGNPENSKRTRISFDEADFVMEGSGVQHLEE